MRMDFKNKTDWLDEKRQPLLVDGYNFVEGYVKKYNNFEFYWVNRAGHFVAADNPLAMSKILSNLTVK